MIKKNIIITIQILFLTGKIYCANDSLFFLQNVINKYESKKSISYDISYKFKSLFYDDTFSISGSCKLLRVKNDTTKQGFIWYKTTDDIEIFYDLINIHAFDYKKNSYNVYGSNNNFDYGNITAGIIKTFFFDTRKLLNYINDSTNLVNLQNINFKKRNFYLLSIKLQNSNDFSNIDYDIWINKKMSTIEKIIYKLNYNSNSQYMEWNLSKIKFDNVNLKKIKKNIDNSIKKCNQFSSNKGNESIKLLDSNSTAPNFSGKYLNTNDEFTLNNVINDIVILDFSYISCLPCHKLIPFLCDIETEYRNKGLKVFGINSYDQNKTNALKRFVDKNKINYPIILTDINTDRLFNVESYPTCYLINKGKVICSFEGFSLELVNSLRNAIKKELNKN